MIYEHSPLPLIRNDICVSFLPQAYIYELYELYACTVYNEKLWYGGDNFRIFNYNDCRQPSKFVDNKFLYNI